MALCYGRLIAGLDLTGMEAEAKAMAAPVVVGGLESAAGAKKA